MSKFARRFLLLFVLVVGISSAVIYTTVDINTLHNLTRFHSWSLLLALLAVGLGMFFDGSRLMHLVKISNEKITLYQAVQVIFGNYFLALLTPGATGGAVAQVMFLRHAGVPTGKAAVLVIVRTLLSIFFLALCMPFIFLHDEGIVPGVSNDILMAVTLAAFLGIVFIVVGARRGFLDYIVVWIARRLRDKKRHQLFGLYRDTKSAISLLLGAPRPLYLRRRSVPPARARRDRCGLVHRHGAYDLPQYAPLLQPDPRWLWYCRGRLRPPLCGDCARRYGRHRRRLLAAHRRIPSVPHRFLLHRYRLRPRVPAAVLRNKVAPAPF